MSLRQARKYCLFCILLVLCMASAGTAQRILVRGTITNSFTKERIPFASVSWKRSGQGVVSDSAGNFILQAQRRQVDTLLISSVGFNTQIVPLTLHKDTTVVSVFLENTRDVGEVVVRSKYNRGLLWWKKIVANKPVNNPYKQESYSYELYNKVEVDIDN
ncbi:MAG TPA: carboxypeptidase-like regulatory domain-containing protein, partial [Puia sp.]|nr:carboxypeptidase-like regulatory domain-containing protein [Puia sp.]